MDELTFGVDPGLNGSCVGLINGEPQVDLVVRAKTYEIKTSSVAKRRMDIEALYDDLQNLKCVRGATVYIEDPNVMFKNGATRIKTQFKTIGAFEAVFVLLGAEQIISIPPVDWKKKYGLLKKKKRASCDRVRELFPKFDLMAKDADIAEALLIGRYGYRYKRGAM